MSWKPPHPPVGSVKSVIAYWREVLGIPDDEPSAPILRAMAVHRLLELRALPDPTA